MKSSFSNSADSSVAPKSRLRAACLLILFLLCFPAIYSQTTLRKQVETEEDLPRFSYPVTESAAQLVEADLQGFAKLGGAVRADIDKTLRDYEIADHGALRRLLQARVDLQIVSGGEDKAALDTVRQIRQLEDKAAAKVVSGLEQEAFLRSRLASPQAIPGSCPTGFEAAYRDLTASLPWRIAGQPLNSENGFLDLTTSSFLAGQAESNLGPALAEEHALSLADAELLLELRAMRAIILPCKQPIAAVLTAYIAKNKVEKVDIWAAREAVMPPVEKLTPVNVGIWDSGIDTSLFAGKLYTNPSPGSDDAHGIAFDVLDHPTHGELIPLTPQQTKDYPMNVSEMQGIEDLQAEVDSDAAKDLKQKVSRMSPQEIREMFDEFAVLGGYAHGTHVAGIAANGNPAVRLAYARITYDNDNPRRPPTEELQQAIDRSYAESVDWFKTHQIRVVNMSWWDRPSNFEKDLADNGVGKDVAERKQIARHLFEMERDSLFAALQSAPDVLFVTIAGNNDANNAFEECIPSSFRLPNLIVTGAVDQSGDETDFTSYGDNVMVHADGYQVESVVPGGTRVKMSGTSMAAPEVTNLAAKLLAIDPALAPAQLIDLIRDGSDKSADGRRNLINPKRSVELLASGKK